MIDVRKIARKNTVVCELMGNREKGETEDLVKASMKEDKTFTLEDCEMCHIPNEDGELEAVWVYTLKEAKNHFFFAGFVLKKVFDSVVEELEGDYEATYQEIRKAKLVIKYGQKKTRDGKRTVTTIDFI